MSKASRKDIFFSCSSPEAEQAGSNRVQIVHPLLYDFCGHHNLQNLFPADDPESDASLQQTRRQVVYFLYMANSGCFR